jgi:hypothetical protein
LQAIKLKAVVVLMNDFIKWEDVKKLMTSLSEEEKAEIDRLAEVYAANIQITNEAKSIFGDDIVESAYIDNTPFIEALCPSTEIPTGEVSDKKIEFCEFRKIYIKFKNGKLVEISTSEWCSIVARDGSWI